MPKILIKNEKGLFASIQWTYLISEVGFERLETALPRIETEHPELWPAARDLHAWCSVLPKVEACMHGKKGDLCPGEKLNTSGLSAYGKRWVRGWLSVGNFVGKSGGGIDCPMPPTAQNFGWVSVEAILKREKEFCALAKWLDITPPMLDSAKGILKKAMAWEIAVVDPQDRLASAESFAIYWPHRSGEGYLNDKGSVSPLGGARLFESAEAAKRTIKSRQLHDALVVVVQARVSGISPVVPVCGPLGALDKALAMEEARQLQAVLATASLESLRKRVQELESAASQSTAAGVGRTVSPTEPTASLSEQSLETQASGLLPKESKSKGKGRRL